MAKKEELEITIAPDGTVNVMVKCGPGMKCVELTKFLEESLGGEVLDRQFTGDYYAETEKTGVTVEAGDGTSKG